MSGWSWFEREARILAWLTLAPVAIGLFLGLVFPWNGRMLRG